ncbi:hypothetical protein D3C71_1763000 [compost metagenome]
MKVDKYLLVVQSDRAKQRYKRDEACKNECPVPGLKGGENLLQSAQHHGQQRSPQKETQLAIDIPQRAGVRHFVKGHVKKSGGLCGAAAQTATSSHQYEEGDDDVFRGCR